MLTFSEPQLMALIAGYLWPLARIAALIGTAPIFGNLGVPMRVKAALALGVTAALAPLAGTPPAVEPFSLAGFGILAEQMLIGAAMGLAVRLVFTVVDVAGELASLQMGLGFATFYDPQHGVHSPVIAQFLGLLASLMFLGMNGHLMVMAALAESFRLLPIGAALPASFSGLELARWGGTIFAHGLLLALPVVAALLITNVALGVLARAAPQLNLFAVGFPVTILVGLAVLALALPLAAPQLLRLFELGLRMMLVPLGG